MTVVDVIAAPRSATTCEGRDMLRPPPALPHGLHLSSLATDTRLRRALGQHRECSAEHAPLVRAACVSAPWVLPRRHQDDRGHSVGSKGFRELAPDGAYSQIPVWRSREHWAGVVVPIAAAAHPEILKRHKVAAGTLITWAWVKSGYAASKRTGRQCIVRPDTLASVLQLSKRQVQKLNACARELGLEVVVVVGRMLNDSEKDYARATGSRQRGLATEVALTTPQFLQKTVDEFTPPKRYPGTSKSHPISRLRHGLAAEQKGPTSSAHRRKRSPGVIAARRLAAEVVTRVPWLASERPGRLAPALTRFTTCPRPWTAQEIAGAIRDHSLRRGLGEVQADTIRTRPAALLASILRQIDPETDHPADPFEQADTPAPSVCRRPDCDGHGWIELPTGAVTPCPECPSHVRRSRRVDQPHPEADKEPLF